jgi:Ser/Thr protein kinase RdoA (MazF antagonist)
MVGTPRVKAQQALAVARLWNAGAAQPVHIRDAENSSWGIELGGRRVVLRLTSEAHRTREQLEAELDFVDHVAAGGLNVAPGLESLAGQRIVDASRFVASGERTYAAVFPRFEGRNFEYYSADIDRPLFHLWGRAMGRLHALSQSFKARREFRRPDWPDDAVAGCCASGVAEDDEALPLRNQLIAWLHGQASEPAHYGMVHGDFERTNFLLHDGSIQIFDFDDCCHHWFCWDIACALWVFRNASREERAHYLGWFLEGYGAVREPDATRLERFPDLIRLRTVALLLHRLRKVQSTSAMEEEWIQRTRNWLRSPWSW